MDISGKVVLITGASQGIGAACAATFARRGAKLALTARNAEMLERVGGSEAAVIAGDLTEPETRDRIVSETVARFGRIDILINSAGVGLYQPAFQADMRRVRELFELNFFATLGMIQAVVPVMRNNKSGCIVNLGSIAGKVTLPWFTIYSASKFAIGSLTDGLRMELRGDGIHAMTVCPGFVMTAFQENVLSGSAPESVRRNRSFKITPQQCAEAIARGVERNARTVVTPAIGWGFVLLERILPGLVDRRLQAMHSSPQ